MKTNMSKGSLIAFAVFLSAFSMTMTSINPVNGQMAGVLLYLNTKSDTTPDLKTSTTTKTEISGRYPVGVTIFEDFLKKGSDETIQEVFINGKRYRISANGIQADLKNGYHDIRGTLDSKTGVVTLSSAKFAGEIFDGLKDESATKDALTGTKVKKKKVAVFLMDYQDSATQPFYPSTVNEIMFGNGKFKQYFNEASYGRQSIAGDVFGWYTILPTDGGCQGNVETDVASVVAGNNQIDLNNYSNILIITLCPGSVSYGMSNTGPQPYTINGTLYNKTVTWVNTSASKWNQTSDLMQESMSTPYILTNLEWLLVHEFGHALGLGHAHAISCQGTIPTNNCQGVGLGNYYDAMAYNAIGLHFSAWAKAKLGWFNSTELGTITQSGTYTVQNLEAQPGNTGISTIFNSSPKAYKIKPSANSNKTPIWIEFRKATGFDSGIATPALGGMQGGGGEVPPHNIADNQNGIMIYKQGFENMFSGTLNPETARMMYLRGAPNVGSNSNPYQASLNVGQVYSEPRYGLSITTLPTLNTNTRRFQVTMNPNMACTNLAPTVIVSGPSTPLPSGSTLWINSFVRNMDYISCPNSSFSYDFDFGGLSQNGNTSNLSSFLSNLAPEDERQFLFGVYIPPGAPDGTYNVSATITNQTSGLSTTSSVPIIVQ